MRVPSGLYLAEPGVDGGGWFGVKESGGSRFTFEGVAPGSYAIAAVVDETRMWAMTTLTVSNQDQSVALTLQPAMSAAGRVVFQGTHPPPSDLTAINISMSAIAIAGGLVVEPLSTDAKADGTFAVDGLMPGSYKLLAYGPDEGPSKGEWALRSAIVDGQDISDYPLDVRAGTDIGRITITFTDKPSELSGRLQDSSGRPASDYFIIVFSADERTWSGHSRRIMQTRPASDGHYSVRGLPPGDYFIAALTDVEEDEWHDAGFLRQVMPTSLKITLGEGEKKTQDLQIK
ncbi:MAG TPA: carboxypeptidase-like regulatory domain-containing protein [Vicinamibacterales bacterium]|nr:carboxypeptidase-like regulatory domain-containing protein [Vicinamibacterales bacterium]